MTSPDWKYEGKMWKRGFSLTAGIDEVGRGSFAGPVVAGCVVFSDETQIPVEIRINDSKKLTEIQRNKASEWIWKNAHAVGVGKASVTQINKLGIKKASEIAFRKSIVNSKVKVDHLLIDAFYIPYVRGLRRKNQLAIVKGDSKSFSIAAASIIAKVYRDELMTKLSRLSRYKKYGWGENKGYGTQRHRQAIKKYGSTSKHRKQFVESSLKKD